MTMWRKDPFGRDYTVIGLKMKQTKKGGGFPTGYVTIGNTLYKINVSKSNKENVVEWVTLTRIPANNNSRW